MQMTHRLIFHTCKDDAEHLRQSCLGSGLVDQVLTGQIDVVTCAYGQQHGAFMYLARACSYYC